MMNKKVSTIGGSLIIIAIAIALGFVFFSNQEKEVQNQNDVTLNNSELGNKGEVKQDEEKVIENKQEEKSEIPKKEKDCPVLKDQERICKNGITINVLSSGCSQLTCREIVDNKEVAFFSPFIKKDGYVFYENQYTRELNKIIGADTNSFEPINMCASVEMSASHYAKDKNFIYVNSNKMKDIDASTFEYLGSFENGRGMPYSISISQDKNNIYFACGVTIDLADRNTFEILGSSYAKDNKRVYYLDRVLDKADPKTFSIIKYEKNSKFYGNFALDKKYVYLEGAILNNVDPESCKKVGLENCLPNDWEKLYDYASEVGTKLKDGVY